MSLLSAISLSYSYEGKNDPTIHDFNFEIREGEFISIVGPSGSGKTTLLKLLAGHINPSKGRVLFHGEELEGPDIRLVPGYEEIKLVYQQYELRPNISAKENIASVLNEYTLEYRTERVNFLLDFFKLNSISDHKPYQLSGGQQQRLAIAKAMANEPEVLLMDEPFSALDPMNSALFLTEVKRLAQETGTCVILVTHDTRDAMMADKIVVLMNGEIKQLGTPQEIYYQPRSYEIASFFGPINKFSAEEMSRFGISAKDDCLIRAEGFRLAINEGSLTCLVKEVLFRGSYQILLIQAFDYKEILIFDFEKRFAKGNSVSVSVEAKDVIFCHPLD
ncbi:MAG: ABC transporter ATP-binding protein [Cyclobacteriaceae bacterium]